MINLFEVTVSRDGSTVHQFSCKAVCMAYDDGNNVSTVVSADPDVDMLDMTVLGCSAATSALRASSVANSNDAESGSQEVDTDSTDETTDSYRYNINSKEKTCYGDVPDVDTDNFIVERMY